MAAKGSKNADAYALIGKEIGQRIRWARELVEPNRSEFARWMGLDTSVMRDIEHGRRPPSIVILLELCHRLRLSPQYVLWGSLQGVDGELATRLVREHPELASHGSFSGNPGRAGRDDTSYPPRKPYRIA